jgi:hypothetical protein
MTDQAPCEICGNQAEYVASDYFPGRRCPRCGEFDYDRSVGWRKITSPDEMVRLSGWVREQNAAGARPVRLTPEISRRVTRMRIPALRERANRALGAIAKKFPDVRTRFRFEEVATGLEFQARTYSRDADEAIQLTAILSDDEYLRTAFVSTSGTDGSLTPKGLLAADDLDRAGSGSAQGFVAMRFDRSLMDAWTNGFDPGLRAAGFRPFRIDNKDYVGGITDEIMAEIRRSRFVVADYTGQVNGVYFEAGFALGLGLTVIPTCRADEVPKLHFDIKHLNTLLWNTPPGLAEGLNRRIRAVIGVGPDAPDRE